MPMFDPTISFGNLLTVGFIVFGLVGSWYAAKQVMALLELRVMLMESEIKGIERSIENIASILRDQAVHAAQIIGLQRQIDELKHGEGFVLPISRSPHEAPPR